MPNPTKEALDALRSELLRYNDRLLEGAVDAMMRSRQWRELAAIRNPALLAGEVARFFAEGYADRFIDPTYEPTGKTDPVKEAIFRYKDLMLPGAPPKAFASWYGALRGMAEPALSEEVRRRLADPSANVFLRDPLPARTDRRRADFERAEKMRRENGDATWMDPRIGQETVKEVDEETGTTVELRDFRL